jgi:hypothetical protein
MKPTQIDLAFDQDEQSRDTARTAIISTNSLVEFRSCVDRARSIQDLENLEFWLVEIVTSTFGLEEISLSIVELAEEVHIPDERFAESLLYLKYVEKSVFGDLQKRVIGLIETCEEGLRSNSRVVVGESWKSVDLSQPLVQGLSDQEHYDRFIAYFHHINEDTMAPIFDQMKVSFLPNALGFFNGLAGNMVKFGVKRDVIIQAFVEFRDLCYPSFRPGVPRSGSPAKTSEPTKSTSTEVPTPPQGRSSYGISKS